MDIKTLESLQTALNTTPGNTALLMVILRGYLELQEPEAAYRIMKNREGVLKLENPADQHTAAEICLRCHDPQLVLQLCLNDTPEGRLIRARAYLDLNRISEGLQEYRLAVTQNPALEDKNLEANLTAQISKKSIRREGKVTPLKVISKDDTDQTELKRLLRPEAETVTFGDVGGLERIKKEIFKKIILPFQKPSLFQRFKKRIGGGILLYGPPGCGKTLLARATAGECHARFFNVLISDILDMYIGESERKLHALFENARQAAPSVLFFDELEALGSKRQYTHEITSSKVVSQFLSEMDGFSRQNTGVLVLAATNVPWAIDTAFRRPGRFDRVLFVPPPDRDARERILQIHLKDRPVNNEIDLALLLDQTSGFSGADIFNLVETASDLAIEKSLQASGEVPLSAELLKQALREVKPTTLDWLTTARNYARYANESGQYNEVLDFLKQFGKD